MNDSVAPNETLSKEQLLERVQELEEELRMTRAFLSSPDPDVTVNGRDATLTWFGRKRFLAEKIIPVKLKPIPEESLNPTAGPHRIIDGDNLSVMTSLLTDFRGGGTRQGFDVIYMDPPYNTGQDIFAYNDHYLFSKREVTHYERRVPQVEKLVSLDDPSRHTKWINHIAPRLWAARKLLKSTGVIIISIDEHELPRLWMLMEELFGEENRIATLIWERARKNDANYISEGHEYMLVWSRDKNALDAKRKKMADTPEWKHDKGKWRKRKEGVDAILTAYAAAKKRHGNDIDAIQAELDDFFDSLDPDHPARNIRYRHVDERHVYNDDGDLGWPGGRGPHYYDLIHPTTDKPCKVPKNGWRYAKEDMLDLKKQCRIAFKDDHTGIPRMKRYLDEMENEVYTSVIQKVGQRAVETVEAVLGKNKFKNPKDHEILAELINLVTWRDREANILDPYAGSSTTAHAVLELNLEDDGNRQFVLIEHGNPGPDEKIPSERYTSEITAERVRRVITGNWADGGNHPSHNTGFTFYRAREEITRQSIMSATREQLSDIILQVVEDQSNKIDYRIDGYKYLIGRTAKGFGIALVWGDDCNDRDGQTLTQDVRNDILDEAEAVDAMLPVFIYATGRTAAINDDLYRFCQIPNWILARLGISELEDVEDKG